MMEEFTADEHPAERNQKKDTMHIHIHTNAYKHNLPEGGVKLPEAETWPEIFRDEKLIDVSPPIWHVVILLGHVPLFRLGRVRG